MIYKVIFPSIHSRKVKQIAKMLSKSMTGWCLFSLLMSSLIMTTIALPQHQAAALRLQQQENDRKFAEKPNALKKVALDDIDDDLQTNQIGDSNSSSPNGFSWSNVMGSVLQMIFNGGMMAGPNKSDDLDSGAGFPQSPWAQIFTVGLKIITAILGGGQSSDGIDKVDNGGPSSPMQVRIV